MEDEQYTSCIYCLAEGNDQVLPPERENNWIACYADFLAADIWRKHALIN